jgi:hypothetical protein
VSIGVWIVFNCSDRPFFNKTPKNMPIMEKTIKQFITGPLSASPKQPRFLSLFWIALPMYPHPNNLICFFCQASPWIDIRFQALAKKSRFIQRHLTTDYCPLAFPTGNCQPCTAELRAVDRSTGPFRPVRLVRLFRPTADHCPVPRTRRYHHYRFTLYQSGSYDYNCDAVHMSLMKDLSDLGDLAKWIPSYSLDCSSA